MPAHVVVVPPHSQTEHYLPAAYPADIIAYYKQNRTLKL